MASIRIIGSVAYKDEFATVRTVLEQRGHKVGLPRKDERLATKEDRRKHAERMRVELEKADSVLVLNYAHEGVKHALSPAMLLEVGVAFYLGKPVYLFGDFPAGEVGEELRRYEAVALQGDLSRF